MDYLPYLYISRAYIVLGKSDSTSQFNDLALENSTKALEISPTFIRTYYEVAQAYINKNDYEKAILSFQKAAELNPDLGLLIKPLANLNRFKEAAIVLEDLIKLQPTNADYYAQLAVAYGQLQRVS